MGYTVVGFVFLYQSKGTLVYIDNYCNDGMTNEQEEISETVEYLISYYTEIIDNLD